MNRIAFRAPAPCCGLDVLWTADDNTGEIPRCTCPQTSAPLDASEATATAALVGDIERSGTGLAYGGVG